jgi:uncharacterized membrane protein
MKVAYPQDYAGIQWLNDHVHGAKTIAEAPSDGYAWLGRVAEYTGLPTIQSGIHEGEQRYSDELVRTADVTSLYLSTSSSIKSGVLERYHVAYIFVGFIESHCFLPDPQAGTQGICYSPAGVQAFHNMVGHGLTIVFHRSGITIYRVVRNR